MNRLTKCTLIAILALASVITMADQLPSDITQRPPGWRDPVVEGILVRPDSSCTYTEFQTELAANRPLNAYTIERYNNTTLRDGSKNQYAIVFSTEDATVMYYYQHNVTGDLYTTSFNTTDDVQRLRLLKAKRMADKNSIMQYRDSRQYEEQLRAYYESVYSHGCVRFSDFQWMVPLAGRTNSFANAATEWSGMISDYPASASQVNDNAVAIAIIDGPLNTTQIPTAYQTKIEVPASFINSPPGQLITPTVSDGTAQHANLSAEVINDLAGSAAKKTYVIPITPKSVTDYFSASLSTLGGVDVSPAATIKKVTDALGWVIANAVSKNIGVVNIPMGVPTEGDQQELFSKINTLDAMNVLVIRAAGNEGVEYFNPTRYAAGVQSDVVVGSVVGSKIVSNWGDATDTVVNLSANSGQITSTAPGGSSMITDFDTQISARSSTASSIVSAAALRGRVLFPWMTSGEFANTLVTAPGYPRPDYVATWTEETRNLEDIKWANTKSMGSFNARDFMRHLSEYYQPHAYRTLQADEAYLVAPQKTNTIPWYDGTLGGDYYPCAGQDLSFVTACMADKISSAYALCTVAYTGESESNWSFHVQCLSRSTGNIVEDYNSGWDKSKSCKPGYGLVNNEHCARYTNETSYPAKVTTPLWHTMSGPQTDSTADGLCGDIGAGIFFVPDAGQLFPYTNGTCQNKTHAVYANIYADVVLSCPLGGKLKGSSSTCEEADLNKIPVGVPEKCPFEPLVHATTTLAKAHAKCKVDAIKAKAISIGSCEQSPKSSEYCAATSTITMNGNDATTGAYKYSFPIAAYNGNLATTRNGLVTSPWTCPIGSHKTYQNSVAPFDLLCERNP